MTTGISAAASAPAAQASASAPPLVFRSDAADIGFPWAGAALLLVLTALAVAAKWRARQPGGLALPWLGRRPADGMPLPGRAEAALAVESSVRLDAQTQLHVVRWDGRRLLLASTANHAPVVVDRRDEPSHPAQRESTP